MLTDEPVDDWLEKLGYGRRTQPVRSFKKLGWRRLVAPFTPTWRQHWAMSLASAANEIVAETSLDSVIDKLADVA